MYRWGPHHHAQLDEYKTQQAEKMCECDMIQKHAHNNAKEATVVGLQTCTVRRIGRHAECKMQQVYMGAQPPCTGASYTTFDQFSKTTFTFLSFTAVARSMGISGTSMSAWGVSTPCSTSLQQQQQQQQQGRWLGP
jgi:hypothetical protein